MSLESAKQRFSEPIEVDIACNRPGIIRLVDLMGDSAAIVQAARVSYGSGTKTAREDRGLIRYMYSHGHTSPFEMPVIRLHIVAPIDVIRQWIRHRTASVNERSTRYSVIDETPFLRKEFRKQSKSNKQGSGDGFSEEQSSVFTMALDFLYKFVMVIYEWFIDEDMAREQARMHLPLGAPTELYWQMDLKNLLHFLSLRMDSHAQWEIRQYANAIAEIVQEWVPEVWEAFEDYDIRRGGCTVSRMGRRELERRIYGRALPPHDEDIAGALGMSKREWNEFNKTWPTSPLLDVNTDQWPEYLVALEEAISVLRSNDAYSDLAETRVNLDLLLDDVKYLYDATRRDNVTSTADEHR